MSDIQSILAWYDAAPSVARLHKASSDLTKIASTSSDCLRIAVLRNITIEMISPALILEVARLGQLAIIQYGEFDTILQDAFAEDGWLTAFDPHIIVIAQRIHGIAGPLIHRFNSLSSKEVKKLVDDSISQCRSVLSRLRETTNATLLVHNFEEPLHPAGGFIDASRVDGQLNTIRAMNSALASIANDIPSTFIVDMPLLMAQVGHSAAIDERYWQSSRAPYKPAFLARLAQTYTRPIAVKLGKTKKCIVLDCDNTLWGGVIGEDGMEGIKIGQTYPGSAFRDFQLAVLDLSKRGILLALCSKNNEADAMEVFSSHPEMVLRPEHFAAKRINWEPKASNLMEIARELNIGTDSLAFFDDNPIECEQVLTDRPEILTVCLSGDPSGFRDALTSLNAFDTLTLTDEDKRRSEMYRAQSERNQLLGKASSIHDYLTSLQMKVVVRQDDSEAVQRIAQLTQKTNQFNLSTKRYTDEEITCLMNGPNSLVFSARVTDKFDDNGIVAVAIVWIEGNVASIDTFLMSCRVIGRGVETVLLSRVMKEVAKHGVAYLRSRFVPTSKNEPAKRFLSDNGFAKTSNEYEYELQYPASVQEPDWFESVVFEGINK